MKIKNLTKYKITPAFKQQIQGGRRRSLFEGLTLDFDREIIVRPTIKQPFFQKGVGRSISKNLFTLRFLPGFQNQN